MSEYGKQVKNQMEDYMDNPNSIDKELSDIQNATHGVEVRGALAAGVKKSFDKSVEAEATSENAQEQVNNIQSQVNQLVVEGDSSVEAAQARVDSEGNTYSTLKERLDDKETEFSSQLAQTQKFPILDFEVDVVDESYPYTDPRRFGAKSILELGYETFDSSFAVQNTLLSHPSAVLDDGDYILGNITVPYKKTLTTTDSARIIVMDDVDLVKLEAQSKFINIDIVVMVTKYTKDLIEFSSATVNNNPDRLVPEIYNIHVDFVNYWNHTGTIFHFWATNEDEEGNKYNHEGFSFLNVHNIRVNGAIKYFTRLYSFKKSGVTGNPDNEGWVTDNWFNNISIAGATWGFFFSKSEETMLDPRYSSDGRHGFDYISMQGGYAHTKGMFYFSGGTHELGKIMPWDWKTTDVTNNPYRILDGSSTLLKFNGLPLRGGILENISLTSTPTSVVTSEQKTNYILLNYISQSSIVNDDTIAYNTSFKPRRVSFPINGNAIVLAEGLKTSIITLNLKINAGYTLGGYGNVESDVVLIYSNGSLRYTISPYIDLSLFNGAFYVNVTEKEGKEFVQFIYHSTSTNSTHVNNYFYSVNPNWGTYGTTTSLNLNPYNVDFSTLVNPIEGINNSVTYIPTTSRAVYITANPGAIVLDENTNQLIMRDMDDTFKSLGKKVDVPSSMSSQGSPGDWAVDYNYFYVCSSANVWRRVELSSW